MRVREQNEFHAQVFLLDALQHSAAIGAGIERDRFTVGRVPNEIGVYRDVAIFRVELGEALDFANRFRIPFPGAEFTQRSRVQLQCRSDPGRRLVIERAIAQFANAIRTHPRFFRELTVRYAQASLRFADHVGEIVLERNGHALLKGDGPRCRAASLSGERTRLACRSRRLADWPSAFATGQEGRFRRVAKISTRVACAPQTNRGYLAGQWSVHARQLPGPNIRGEFPFRSTSSSR